MDYGKLFSRAFEIVRQRPFLIILGILAAIASPWNGGGNGGGGNGGSAPPPAPGGLDMPLSPDFINGFNALPVALIGGLICFGLIVGILLFVVGTIAKGGLVAGVDDIEDGRATGFSAAWGAGWRQVWRLVGISLIPAIPVLLMLIFGVIMAITTFGFAALSAANIAQFVGGSSIFVFVCAMCLLVPIAMALSLLSGLAMRAAMLEGTGVIDSYRRGWQVLRANLASALIIFLIQIGIGFVIFLGFLMGGAIALLCFCLWPLFLVLGGAVAAYFSAVWTLAWREWTGRAKPPTSAGVPLPPVPALDSTDALVAPPTTLPADPDLPAPDEASTN